MPCTTYLRLDPISSTGTRDVLVDITGDMESGEFLTMVEVVSTQPTLLGVSNVGWNTQAIIQGGHDIESRMGAVFSLEGLLAGTTAEVELLLSFEGSSNSSDVYTLIQPIQGTL